MNSVDIICPSVKAKVKSLYFPEKAINHKSPQANCGEIFCKHYASISYIKVKNSIVQSKFKFPLVLTTSYHPQCDGQTERQNRTIQAMLSSFVSNWQDDWDLWLDSVTSVYNPCGHDSLVMSPYEVVFGQLPRWPVELELGMPLPNPFTPSEYLISIRSALNDIRRIA